MLDVINPLAKKIKLDPSRYFEQEQHHGKLKANYVDSEVTQPGKQSQVWFNLVCWSSFLDVFRGVVCEYTPKMLVNCFSSRG